MKQYNLIMFNMSRYRDWESTGVVNRNYHILHAFEKDPRIKSIIAVDMFPINAKRGLKFALQNFTVKNTEFRSTTSVTYRASEKTVVYSTVQNLISPKRILTELNSLIDKHAMRENLLIWSCNPLYTDYLDAFPGAIKIFDAVDNWTHHSSHSNKIELLKSNYQTLVAKSDLVFTVSESLVDDLNSDHTYWIPNAVDPEHFLDAVESLRLQNIPKPRIGFLGILQDRLDIGILEAIAREIPDASLVLAGPVWKNFDDSKLRALSNVYFTGAVSYKEIPEFYAGFNVGIIPYKNNEFIKSTNSMKYYEYLSAGLPVVSTPAGGIEKFNGIISVANNSAEFVEAIKSSITQYSDSQRYQRREFVASESWKKRMETIFSLIDNIA